MSTILVVAAASCLSCEPEIGTLIYFESMYDYCILLMTVWASYITGSAVTGGTATFGTIDYKKPRISAPLVTFFYSCFILESDVFSKRPGNLGIFNFMS